MTNWGSYDGHIQVGIDWTVTPANPSHDDTTVQVTWKWSIRVNQSFGDGESLHVSTSGDTGGTQHGGPWSNDVGFQNNLSNGDSKVITTHTATYDISYAGNQATASGNINGSYNGSNANNSVTINLPARPKAVPSSPTFQTTGVDNVKLTSGANTAQADIHGTKGNDDGGDAPSTMQFQYATNSSFSSPQSQNQSIGPAGNSDTTLTGLKAGTTYWVRLRTQNSVGWSAWSGGSRSFTTPDLPVASATVPDDPSSLIASSVGPNSITLDWESTGNGGATLSDAEVKIGTAIDSGANVVAPYVQDLTFGSYQSSYTFTGLNPSTTYYIQVRAKNSVGWSGWSDTYNVSTLAPATSNPPGKPTTPTINKTAATTASLSFVPPSSTDAPITSYDFQWDTSATFPTGHNYNASVTQTSPYQYTGLPSNTALYFRFRANNANGNGAWSDYVQATTQLSGSDGTLVQKVTTALKGVGTALKPLLRTTQYALMTGSNIGTPLPTTDTTIPGQTVTISPGRWLVLAHYDIQATSTPAGVCIGQLQVAGVSQSVQLLFQASSINDRYTVGQMWQITVAATTTLTMTVRNSTSSNGYALRPGHTAIVAIPIN